MVMIGKRTFGMITSFLPSILGSARSFNGGRQHRGIIQILAVRSPRICHSDLGERVRHGDLGSSTVSVCRRPGYGQVRSMESRHVEGI